MDLKDFYHHGILTRLRKDMRFLFRRSSCEKCFKDYMTTSFLVSNTSHSLKYFVFNPLSANPIKWSNTQTICRLLPTNCLGEFDRFVGLALKELSFNCLEGFISGILDHVGFCHYWQVSVILKYLQADIYLLKVSNKNTKRKCQMCLQLTTKTTEGRQ